MQKLPSRDVHVTWLRKHQQCNVCLSTSLLRQYFNYDHRHFQDDKQHLTTIYSHIQYVHVHVDIEILK